MLGSCSMDLKKDHTYEAIYESAGICWYNTGKFDVKNNKLYFEPIICKDSRNVKDFLPCDKTLGRAVCKIIEDLNSLYYTKFLECISLDNNNVLGFNSAKILFPIKSYRVKSGEERRFNGINVIVLTGLSGITTGNVKIRKEPSINSESLKYQDKIIYDTTGKISDFVPKDTKVNIIARTKNKHQVDKWNNYWYLITVGMNSEVWMYGEFIKLR